MGMDVQKIGIKLQYLSELRMLLGESWTAVDRAAIAERAMRVCDSIESDLRLTADTPPVKNNL